MTKTNIQQQDRPLYSLTISEYIELNRQILLDAKESSNTSTENTSDEILTIEQASQLLKLAKPTIYGLTCRNEIPFIKKAKKLYFHKSELMDWLQEGRQKTNDEIREEVKATGTFSLK